MSHFCHAEPVEACRDIKHLHSPFDGLRVTVVTFYEFMTYRLYIIVSTSAVSGSCEIAVNASCFKVFMLNLAILLLTAMIGYLFFFKVVHAEDGSVSLPWVALHQSLFSLRS
jgi:hypothetical protein